MHNMQQLEATVDVTINPGAVKEAMKALGAGSSDLWKPPVDQLRVIEGFNIRVHNAAYQAKIDEYANLLFEEGWLDHKPMVGIVQRDDATGENLVYILDGHTRLLSIPIANARRAAAGKPLIEKVTVVAIPSKKGKEAIDVVDMTVVMVQGNKGNPHSAYEYAIACKRLADNGEATGAIARRLGLSGEWVKSLLMLMSAPKELRERVANDALTVTLAVQLLKEHGGDEAAEMVEEAVAEKEAQGKPIRLTKKNIKPNNPFTKAVKRSAPAMYTALETVKLDPAFAKLSADTREKLLEIMATLEKAKDDGAVDHSQQSTIFDTPPSEPEKNAA